jgi:hypothetical protein
MAEEIHVEGFRGVWIPAEIMYLFWDGTLSAQEMMLLTTIDGLVSRNPAGQFVGCYASNAYLGKRLGGICAERVSRIISRLVSLNLVTITGFNGRKRYIETRWSRINKN